MQRILKYANLLAIVGTAWMALVIISMRSAPSFMQELTGHWGGFVTVSLTEPVFAALLFLFFGSLHFYNVRVKRIIDPYFSTLAGLIGASWMILVAVLHRFPAVWHWFATQQSGMVLTMAQTFFVLPFLIFFVLFYYGYNRGRYTVRLRVATVIAAVGQLWFLLVSATRISPSFWHWLIQHGIRRFMMVTEPFVVLSLLLFLVCLYFEPRT
ncbi:MAG: hypothetical protein PVI51_08360 [candidate division WOR-3 bacterium]|jgi:hypothetical protein